MRGSRVGVLAPLAYRDFRLMAMAALSSLVGDGFFRVAIAVQVYAISNDPRSLAAVAVSWAGAQVLLLPLGGWASDRFERRRIMILADLWRAGAVGAIGVLSLTHDLALWHLLVLGGAFGAGNGFFNPAATSLLPDVLPEHELQRANAFLGVARPTMLWILGPLVGGLVISVTEPGAAFLLDSVSFLVSAPLLAAISVRLPGDAQSGGLRQSLRAVGEGLRFVIHHSWVGLWLVAAAVSTLAFHGPFDVLVPFLLKNEFGMSDGEVARSLGFILAAGGAGSIIVSTVIGQRNLPRRFMTTLYGCETAGVLAIVGFGIMTAPWQAMVAGLVVFSMFAAGEIIWHTSMQRLVPRGMLGRVSSLDWMASVGLALFSFALAGPLGARFGAREVLVGSGLIGATALLVLMAVPGSRAIENRASGWMEGSDSGGGTAASGRSRSRSDASGALGRSRTGHEGIDG